MAYADVRIECTTPCAPPLQPPLVLNKPAQPASRLAALPAWLQMPARVLAWGFGLAAAGLVALLCMVALALAVAYPNLPEISSVTDYRPKLPMRVFSSDGVEIGEFGEERRTFVPIGEIPQVMKDAVLAAEDARFYQHGGVDYKGVVRAAFENLRDARSQGASTITMQVARNFYLSTEKTFTRKIYEILLALKIESQLSKDQILELYMNQIFLGRRANGFAAAAEIYFDKNLKDVSVAEAAMLAGLPKAPSAFNPISNPRRALVRQRYIINRMYETGFITEGQQEEALAAELRYRQQPETVVYAEFVAETVRQLVFAQYGEDAYARGLNVYSSINSEDQMVAYRALRRGLMEFELRQVYRGPEAYVDLPTDPALLDARVAETLAERPDQDDLLAAVVLEASPRSVVVMLQSGESITVTGDGLRPVTSGLAKDAPPKVQIRPGAVVRLYRTPRFNKGNWALTQAPEVEGALVALDPRDGSVRALVGGFDFGRNKFNRVTQAWRQPGSSFKPFIYSAGLEKGFTPGTIINDSPLFFSAGQTGSQPWEPRNYDGKFDGPMPLQTALAKSKNMVSIRVMQSTGIDFTQRWLENFGFERSKHPPFLPTALGAGSVTPMQLASGYAVLANGGYRVTPQLITRITDSRGNLLLDAQPKPPGESQRTISARNAFVMSSLLQEVTRSGTAARAQGTLRRPDLYGKTGTTNDSMDAWFAGYQPDLVAVVWMGFDNPKKLGDRETGGGLALPVWIELMQHALKNVPVREIAPPPGVVRVGRYWTFEEFSQGEGITSVGLEDVVPQPPTEEERGSILDLFRR